MKTKLEILDLMFRHLIGIGRIKTQQDISIAINGNKSAVSSAFNGDERYLTSNLLKRINKSFDGIFNELWLLTGEGEMLKTQGETIRSVMLGAVNDKSEIIDEAKKNIQELRNQAQVNTVPLLPISAQAGTLNDFIVSVKDSDAERIISPIKGADFAITVSGDSMSPEYTNGSQILIKKINHNSFIEWGKVYVLDTSNGVVIKIINECKENADCLVCTSINQDQERYAPFKVPKSEIIGMYRVMLCMSMK